MPSLRLPILILIAALSHPDCRAILSGCHMLRYLHLASDAGIIVRSYEDNPVGVGETGPRGEGRFLKATLRLRIVVEHGADLARADALHHTRQRVLIHRALGELSGLLRSDLPGR